MKTNRVMDEIRSTMSPEMKKQMAFYALYNASKRIKTFSESTGGIHILIASPSLVIFQKGMPYLSVYSFIRVIIVIASFQVSRLLWLCPPESVCGRVGSQICLH